MKMALAMPDRVRELEEVEQKLGKRIRVLELHQATLEGQIREADGRATASARAIVNVRRHWLFRPM